MAVHQALPVQGYKPQSQATVALVNRNKEAEERILRILDELAAPTPPGAELVVAGGIDKRWLAIGRTHIEQGFMAINRAIFKPGRATLADDSTE